MKVILIKYGELTTKGDNRKYFINVLYNNIKKALEEYNVNIVSIIYIKYFIDFLMLIDVKNRLFILFKLVFL